MQQKSRKVLVDIEANGLRPDKIWCVVAKDLDTGEKFRFRPKTPFSGHDDFKDEFLKFSKEVKTWVGHNLLGYDVIWMNKLLGTDIRVQDVIDTLVLSRLFRPVSPFAEQQYRMKTDTRVGGHGLEAWGRRLGYPKQEYNDWSQYTEAMLEYCERDVDLNHEVYKALQVEGVGFSRHCIRLEHKVAQLLRQQEENGFYLDQAKAKTLVEETNVLIEEMLEKLHEVFPPVPKPSRKEYEPKFNMDGTMSATSQKMLDKHTSVKGLYLKENGNGTYELGKMTPFNPGSGLQIAERLLAIGWRPKLYTDKGSPKTDKEALKDGIKELLIENPELQGLRYLENYGIITDRNQKAKKWLELVEEDGRVHGNINPIGAGTHRCSHYNDNMANIASVSTSSSPVSDFKIDFKPYKPFTQFDNNKIFLGVQDDEVEYAITGLDGHFGWDSRDCWTVPNVGENVLVGADASGIQLRALAHYMNDKEYTKKLLTGDIHTVHQLAAGISHRSIAKTFIYAWLLGAGDEKIGVIVGVERNEFEELFDYAEKTKPYGKQNLLEVIASGLKRKNRKVTRRLVATITKGYKVKKQFLDRTPALKHLKEVVVPEATKQGYVVGLDGRKLWIPNEHLAMSLYLQGFEAIIMKYALCDYSKELDLLGVPFKQVNFVHDEFQVETPREYGDIVGQTIVNSIKKAGEQLGSLCPLDGEYKIGRSWAETH